MEFLFEILFEVFGELILQVVLEALAEVGIRNFRHPAKGSAPRPFFAAIGYLLLGSAAGGISLLFLPEHLIRLQWVRWINLLVVPLGAGLAMSVLGWLRRKQGKELIRLDSFAYGFLFALATTIVRMCWGQ